MLTLFQTKKRAFFINLFFFHHHIKVNCKVRRLLIILLEFLFIVIYLNNVIKFFYSKKLHYFALEALFLLFPMFVYWNFYVRLLELLKLLRWQKKYFYRKLLSSECNACTLNKERCWFRYRRVNVPVVHSKHNVKDNYCLLSTVFPQKKRS
jgi:hypothetical protein